MALDRPCSACLGPSADSDCECGHAFHRSCLGAWRRAHATACPICTSHPRTVDTGEHFLADAVRQDDQLGAQTITNTEFTDTMIIDEVTLLPGAFVDIDTPQKMKKARRKTSRLLREIYERSDRLKLLYSSPALNAFRVYLGLSRGRWIAKVRARDCELPADKRGSVDTEVLVVFGLTFEYFLQRGYTLEIIRQMWPRLSFEDLVVWGFSLATIARQTNAALMLGLVASYFPDEFTLYGLPDFNPRALPRFLTPSLLAKCKLSAPTLYATSDQATLTETFQGVTPENRQKSHGVTPGLESLIAAPPVKSRPGPATGRSELVL